MLTRIFSRFKTLDFTLLSAMIAISFSGLFTMSSFQGNDSYFWKQGLWIIISFSVFFIASQFEYRFLKQTRVVIAIYIVLLFILTLLFTLGYVSKGAESWFRLGGVAFQPSDLMKLGLIIVLAVVVITLIFNLDRRQTWLPLLALVGGGIGMMILPDSPKR